MAITPSAPEPVCERPTRVCGRRSNPDSPVSVFRHAGRGISGRVPGACETEGNERSVRSQREERRRSLLAVGCLAVVVYAGGMVVASVWTDGPSWLWACHVAVIVLALAVQLGTLRDIETRSDWVRSQRVAWRNWIWSFSLFAVLAYYWKYLDTR